MKIPGAMTAEVLPALFQRPATELYPLVRPRLPSGFRGKIGFSAERCTGCRLCERDCPSNAISIVEVGKKRFRAEVDLSRCIYCAQCVDSCRRGAIQLGSDFELAALDRGKLRLVFDAPSEAAGTDGAAGSDKDCESE